MRDQIEFRISEDGMAWETTPVLVTLDMGLLSFDEITEHCDDIAIRICLIEQKIVRWNRKVPRGTGQGHYVDPYFANRYWAEA